MVHHSKEHKLDLCQNHLKQHVLVETTTGDQIEGYVIEVDDEHVHLVVPSQQIPHLPVRAYGGYGPYGGYYGGGYGPYYGYPPYEYGLSRLIIPLTFVAALSLLPW
ncbi:hypothetical protein J2R98_001581 [Alkalibacillus filiformis]|uniref:Uncharacterized protein n=2 Tax=Alkalibacillus TaxID=331654 RepID=A0A511W3W6_9BACI|nr:MULTISPECIES: hypothetical protein [Alkalibacillus]MDQ0351764.1 hypothetical protein [Alkalibacillus filiformis]GEN45657.1 hypothetical protein AHA02nite_14330 [Alkalibacillus haloalkaliphilus]